MHNLKDQVFGRLTVGYRAPNLNGATMWCCRCSCGVFKIVASASLRTGHTKSCGCLKKDTAHIHKRLRPFEAQYNALLGIAKSSNHECSLSYEDYLHFTKIADCHYCGIAIPWSPYIAGKRSAYFLDRMDNSVGYERPNCVVCCSRCNWGKGWYFSYAEWVEIGATIARLRERGS